MSLVIGISMFEKTKPNQIINQILINQPNAHPLFLLLLFSLSFPLFPSTLCYLYLPGLYAINPAQQLSIETEHP